MSNKLNAGDNLLSPVEKLNSEGNVKPIDEYSSVDFTFSKIENNERVDKNIQDSAKNHSGDIGEEKQALKIEKNAKYNEYKGENDYNYIDSFADEDVNGECETGNYNQQTESQGGEANNILTAEDYNIDPEFNVYHGNQMNFGDDRPQIDGESEYSWDNFENPLINEKTIFFGEPKTKPTSWWLVFTIVFGIYFITSLFTFNVMLIPFKVEGASMEPTINNNTDTYYDVVYLQRSTSFFKSDIVVIDAKNYGEPGKSYIKRVVATAGDRVQFVKYSTKEYWVPISRGSQAGLENGIAYGEYMLKINGELQIEDYITSSANSIISQASKSYNGNIYERDKQKDEGIHDHVVDLQNLESVPGVMILYTQSSEAFYNRYVVGGEEFVVPEGSVFVLGDNRTISNDSKFFGAVKIEDVIGKVRIHKTYDSGLVQAIIFSIKKGYLF